jgi:dTDP-D-glucose 4,6-dehydratase
MRIIDSGVTDEIYNVAGNFEQANVDTVKKIIDCYFDNDSLLEPYVDFSYCREGQDVRYALNDDKLRALGWKPKKKFDEEIPQIVDCYKENFRW